MSLQHVLDRRLLDALNDKTFVCHRCSSGPVHYYPHFGTYWCACTGSEHGADIHRAAWSRDECGCSRITVCPKKSPTVTLDITNNRGSTSAPSEPGNEEDLIITMDQTAWQAAKRQKRERKGKSKSKSKNKSKMQAPTPTPTQMKTMAMPASSGIKPGMVSNTKKTPSSPTADIPPAPLQQEPPQNCLPSELNPATASASNNTPSAYASHIPMAVPIECDVAFWADQYLP